MTMIAETAPVKNPARWTGRVLSGLVKRTLRAAA